jgi:uncharacterized membrane protein YcaP (DUF421 family)
MVLPSDWFSVIFPQTPLLELIARGTLLYCGALALVRLMPKRTGGELATMDLIFVLLIAEAAAHSLGEYTSVADGLVMIIILMLWNWAINALSYHFPAIERIVSAPPTEVIRKGKFLRRNMRREYLTEEELMSHVRKEGISGVESIKSARIESDGRISIVQEE